MLKTKQKKLDPMSCPAWLSWSVFIKGRPTSNPLRNGACSFQYWKAVEKNEFLM
jgi:hypothetical protein